MLARTTNKQISGPSVTCPQERSSSGRRNQVVRRGVACKEGSPTELAGGATGQPKWKIQIFCLPLQALAVSVRWKEGEASIATPAHHLGPRSYASVMEIGRRGGEGTSTGGHTWAGVRVSNLPLPSVSVSPVVRRALY